MTDEDIQPFNTPAGGRIRGMVVCTDHPRVRRLAESCSILTDLGYSRALMDELTTRTIEKARSGGETAKGEFQAVHAMYAYGVVSYGRCFVSAAGRPRKTWEDVRASGASQAIHEELMMLRHEEVAHYSSRSMRLNMYASLAETNEASDIKGLAFIAWAPVLPGVAKLGRIVEHISLIERFWKAACKKQEAALVAALRRESLQELYDCQARGVPFS